MRSRSALLLVLLIARAVRLGGSAWGVRRTQGGTALQAPGDEINDLFARAPKLEVSWASRLGAYPEWHLPTSVCCWPPNSARDRARGILMTNKRFSHQTFLAVTIELSGPA